MILHDATTTVTADPQIAVLQNFDGDNKHHPNACDEFLGTSVNCSCRNKPQTSNAQV